MSWALLSLLSSGPGNHSQAGMGGAGRPSERCWQTGLLLRAAAGSWHRRALRSLPHGAALLPALCLQPASCSASLRRQRFPSPVLKARVPPQLRACPSREAAGFALPGLCRRRERAAGAVAALRCAAVSSPGPGGGLGAAPRSAPSPARCPPRLCRALRGGRGD